MNIKDLKAKKLKQFRVDLYHDEKLETSFSFTAADLAGDPNNGDGELEWLRVQILQAALGAGRK